MKSHVRKTGLDGGLPDGVGRVLAAHVLPHPEDMRPALPAADTVIVPSSAMRAEAQRAGWPASTWQVVPNAVLHQPTQPDPAARAERRLHGPVRVLARLGPEKGILPLLSAAAASRRHLNRRLEVMLAAAGFEASRGGQATLLNQCRFITAAAENITLYSGGLTWKQVPGWLADASLVIIPSLRETFGLVAAEAMSAGTPVIATRVGHLPALLEPAQAGRSLLADPAHGPDALLRLAGQLLADPITYDATSKAVYCRSRNYRPVRIAQLFVKAVS